MADNSFFFQVTPSPSETLISFEIRLFHTRDCEKELSAQSPKVREVMELGWWGNEQARYFPAHHARVDKGEEDGDIYNNAGLRSAAQPDFA